MGLFSGLFSKDEDKETQAQQDKQGKEPQNQESQLPKQDYIKLDVSDVCSMYESVRKLDSVKFAVEFLGDHIYIHDMRDNKLVWRKQLEYALTEDIDRMYIKSVDVSFFQDLYMWVQDTNKGAFVAPYNKNEENRYVVFFVGVRYKILTIHPKDAGDE